MVEPLHDNLRSATRAEQIKEHEIGDEYVQEELRRIIDQDGEDCKALPGRQRSRCGSYGDHLGGSLRNRRCNFTDMEWQTGARGDVEIDMMDEVEPHCGESFRS